MLFPKARPVRSESYRRWVASLPCIACGIEGYSQAAHANQGKGLGMKVSDLRTFPLCAPHGFHMGCHAQFDMTLGMTKAERRKLEAEYVERTQAKAREAGRRELKEAA